MVYKYEIKLFNQYLNNKFGCFINFFSVFEFFNRFNKIVTILYELCYLSICLNFWNILSIYLDNIYSCKEWLMIK